jgi:dTDP-4-amino-4,6-dideoxygalactose transaminase
MPMEKPCGRDRAFGRFAPPTGTWRGSRLSAACSRAVSAKGAPLGAGHHPREQRGRAASLSKMWIPDRGGSALVSQMVSKAALARIRIPLNRPSLAGRELAYIRDAVRRGQISGDGYYTRQASAWLEQYLGLPKILLTPSCTHALEMAFLLLSSRPGQEVICPSFTFPSTANAFVLRGLKPRFIDVRPDTLNLDETLLESRVSSATIAVIPVHYAGVPCEMDVIMEVARKKHLWVVEDAAQALGARFREKPAGTFGELNAFSFHETKNCICGEGGALAIRDAHYIKRAEIIRQKGTNREQFFRGEVDKYSWVDVGSSHVPSELQTAFLLAQLEKLEDIGRRRKRIHKTYERELALLEANGALRLPRFPSHCVPSYHLFYILLENLRQRNRVLEGLRRQGILATFHYFPLHLSAMGKRFGYRRGQFPVSERASERLVRLPMYNAMSVSEQARVVFEFQQPDEDGAWEGRNRIQG